MANLKLGKLPDRTSSKMTITLSAELGQALNDYATLYRQTYGESETVAELIPFMLAGFLEGDRAFAKARSKGFPTAGTSEKSRRQPDSGSD
ncbi:MAG: DUF2274 domain-containing protein [Mesorhizobium sp.]|uniref:DUF2274 domain-containing protein n=1 Tax=Mesorhizobium sp. TaxID=1871066 RepID=UPI001228E449|nr:DUF2274 domain-containing protein [Mesorhizobium sp.]TIP27748.1 MAG: DUF2274 domain-containing protein [Mesorhizobium sp.]